MSIIITVQPYAQVRRDFEFPVATRISIENIDFDYIAEERQRRNNDQLHCHSDIDNKTVISLLILMDMSRVLIVMTMRCVGPLPFGLREMLQCS